MQLQTNHCQIHFGRASQSLSGQVSTEVLTKREVVSVARASESKKAGDVGFIGEGFTKLERGIYVCLLFPILQAHGV